MVERWIFTERSTIDENNYLIVHLHIEPANGRSVEEAASKIAQIVSLSSVDPLPYVDEEERKESSARILSSTESGHIDLAYPIEISGLQEGIPQILALLCYPAEYDYTNSYFIKNITFPDKILSHFPGPKYGKVGFREQFGVNTRPLLGVKPKPRVGTDVEVISNQCRLALEGGADFIVDDELIIDPTTSLNFKNRVELMVNAKREAEKEVGEQKGYIPNISANSTKALKYAVQAEEMGADAVVLNAFTMGFSTLKELRESSEFDLPIITSNMGVGILTRYSEMPDQPGETGISEAVVAKLSRFAGADAVHAGITASEWYGTEVGVDQIKAFRASYPNVRETLPVATGGLNINNVWANISSLGDDVILEAGRGILGYPKGPEKGAEALRILVEELSHTLTDDQAKEKIIEIAKENDHIADAREYYHDGNI